MNLQRLFSAFRYTYKKIFFLSVFLYALSGYGQACTPSPGSVLTYSEINNLTCSFGYREYFDGKVVKILFSAIGPGFTQTFTTVGETDVDTYLALYYDDSSGHPVLLAENDDDTTAYPGCKQSTIQYNPTFQISGPYILLSEKECMPIRSTTGSVKIRFNVTNDDPANKAPGIIEPAGFHACTDSGIQKLFAVDPAILRQIDPWESSDTNIAVVDSQGNIAFKKEGMVQITVTSDRSCQTIKTFKVEKAITTSLINHD